MEMKTEKKIRTEKEIGKEGIKKVVPFREPFLFIDKILVCDEEEIVALKGVTNADCAGHFGIFPGHLALEAIAQAASFLVLSKMPLEEDENLALIKTAGKFHHYVYPGDFLFLYAKQRKKIRNVLFLEGEAIVFGKKVAVWEGAATKTKKIDK